LQAGKHVRLYVMNKLEQQPADYSTLMLYRHLYPWLHMGKLQIYATPQVEGPNSAHLPRVFSSLDVGALLVRQAFPVQALLDGLVAAPAEVGAMDAETREVLQDMLGRSSQYPPEHFAEGKKMAMWEFPVGAPRPLPDLFAAVRGAHVKRLSIRDPYCGTQQNRPRLKQILSFLKEHVSDLECVHVYCSEVKQRERDGSDYVEHRFDVARNLEKLIDDVGVPRNEAFVKEVGRNRTFHDRELTFETVDPAGCSATQRYFLTGGIDYLLDERSDTKVFHAVLQK
jgi:hypothetical protein